MLQRHKLTAIATHVFYTGDMPTMPFSGTEGSIVFSTKILSEMYDACDTSGESSLKKPRVRRFLILRL